MASQDRSHGLRASPCTGYDHHPYDASAAALGQSQTAALADGHESPASHGRRGSRRRRCKECSRLHRGCVPRGPGQKCTLCSRLMKECSFTQQPALTREAHGSLPMQDPRIAERPSDRSNYEEYQDPQSMHELHWPSSAACDMTTEQTYLLHLQYLSDPALLDSSEAVLGTITLSLGARMAINSIVASSTILWNELSRLRDYGEDPNIVEILHVQAARECRAALVYTNQNIHGHVGHQNL